jgi:hypothetical protein
MHEILYNFLFKKQLTGLSAWVETLSKNPLIKQPHTITFFHEYFLLLGAKASTQTIGRTKFNLQPLQSFLENDTFKQIFINSPNLTQFLSLLYESNLPFIVHPINKRILSVPTFYNDVIPAYLNLHFLIMKTFIESSYENLFSSFQAIFKDLNVLKPDEWAALFKTQPKTATRYLSKLWTLQITFAHTFLSFNLEPSSIDPFIIWAPFSFIPIPKWNPKLPSGFQINSSAIISLFFFGATYLTKITFSNLDNIFYMAQLDAQNQQLCQNISTIFTLPQFVDRIELLCHSSLHYLSNAGQKQSSAPHEFSPLQFLMTPSYTYKYLFRRITSYSIPSVSAKYETMLLPLANLLQCKWPTLKTKQKFFIFSAFNSIIVKFSDRINNELILNLVGVKDEQKGSLLF